MNFEEKVKNGELYFEDEYPDYLIDENIELMELLHDFNNCRPKEIEKKDSILKNYLRSMEKNVLYIHLFMQVGERTFI